MQEIQWNILGLVNCCIHDVKLLLNGILTDLEKVDCVVDVE